ncbi:MAG: Fic family protein [Actinomycetota bacterium]
MHRTRSPGPSPTRGSSSSSSSSASAERIVRRRHGPTRKNPPFAPAPIRDVRLLGSAAARPRTTAFGVDAYPDVLSKAGALLHGIVNNHPLVDGSKRLGWLATAVFLELKGRSVAHASNDAVFELVSVAATGQDVESIAAALRAQHDTP